MVTGCSSGGLAAYLHADYLHAKLAVIAPTMTKYVGAY